MTINKLQSGNYYSLNELLSDNHKIIIPDLQRDYCWGNEIHGKNNKTELVTGFLDSLLESFNEKKGEDLTLGMIYAYENPTKHIHLCDGQQRITTLFLLLGMLNKEMSNLIQHKLISEQEMQDDYEPYLRYAVRENTLFFMMDLVKEYFLNNDSSTETPSEYIKKQDWYHEEHNLDASVQSMLSALDIIQKHDGFKNIDKGLFSLFLLEKVKILYYDMENRTHGEEMFVIINTTGEPLTASENIKPILLSQIKDTKKQAEYNNQWEDREEFFWQNRKNGEPTADAGVNEFLTWFLQIELQQDAVSITREDFKKVGIPPELNTNFNEHWYCDLLYKIKKYFEVFEVFCEKAKQEKFCNILKLITKKDCNEDTNFVHYFRTGFPTKEILLPILAFMVKMKYHSNNNFSDHDLYSLLRRLRKNYFDIQRKERNENAVDWRYVLQIVKKTDNLKSFLEFENNFEKLSNLDIPKSIWYNEEEKIKDKIKAKNKQEIECWEDIEDFQGDLTPLFKVSENSEDIEVLKKYIETYQNIKDETYTNNIEIKNRYRVLDLFYRGEWKGGSISGWYSMLCKNPNLPFLNDFFYEIWKGINASENENDLLNFLKENIKKCYDYDKFNQNIKDLCDGRDKIFVGKSSSEYEKIIESVIKTWILLEFLSFPKELFDNTKNVACFWSYVRNFLNYKDDKKDYTENDYQLGNLLLGTSVFRKKNSFDYNLPLMKFVNENKNVDIAKQTAKYQELLEKEFKNK